MQRRARPGAEPAAAPRSALALQGRFGPGRPLDAGVRGRMESGFGRDFSDVRVHTGGGAARLASELSAHAVTMGRHIAFSTRAYRPGTLAGDALIAHELAHTVQQQNAEPLDDGAVPLDNDAGLEAEADRAAAAAFGAGSQPALSERRGLRLQGCSQRARACPAGFRWWPVRTLQWGSFGCTCLWKCLRAPPSSEQLQSATAISCPPDVNCSDPYDRVGDDYTKTGYGAAFTPLTGPPACGCFALDLEGRTETDAPLVPVDVDMTTIIGPGADMAAGARARARGRGGGAGPQTDPLTGERTPGGAPQLPTVVNPTRARAIQQGLFTPRTTAALEGILREGNPAVMAAIERTIDMPAGPARTERIERLLTWAESRPAVPSRLEEGASFGRGGTSSVQEVVGEPGLALKAGGQRGAGEARAMVELELAGVPTVYVGQGLTTTGQTRMVLRRIDGVGSKDIVGRRSAPPQDPALASEYARFVTQRTVDDLHAIRQRLVEARMNVGDFQFIIRRSDGAVFVNDPTNVTFGSGPSGYLDSIIQKFETIRRQQATAATTTAPPAPTTPPASSGRGQ